MMQKQFIDMMKKRYSDRLVNAPNPQDATVLFLLDEIENLQAEIAQLEKILNEKSNQN